MVDTGYKLMDITNAVRWSNRSRFWDNFLDSVINALGPDVMCSMTEDEIESAVSDSLTTWNGWTVNCANEDGWVTEFALWFKTEDDALAFLLRWS